ncbi:UTRA domain-containing protein [Streptomyces sp. Ac-502]|uniref:UTRA domain-containing protein n=1 Tax=Streptomyces sp. Ac-502 TaxID=3342801 RepID=UPI003862CA0D
MDVPHRRLAALLRQRMADGTYPPGSTFPSVRTIAADYEVGLGAAYRAVELLRTEGLLDGEPRRRLTVAHPVAVRTLTDPDAEWPHGHGDVEHASVRATNGLAERLGVSPGTPLRRERAELLDPDGRPAMLVTTWRRGAARRHASFRCTAQVRPMGREEAALLGLAVGTLALLLERTRLDERGAVVEVADLVLPTDRWVIAF